jgi:membrane-associated protease RseP (regulator of RpoE activity)
MEGGEVVDYFLGGNGLILLQDPSTPVPLHPFAIAGFAGLIINAIDCIPIGSTDGGRISQSLLGRTGHLVFSSIIFAGLFLYTLFSGHREIFITYLLLMSFAEKDVEVPCRNEIDRKADVPQVIASLILWIVASLILIPL